MTKGHPAETLVTIRHGHGLERRRHLRPVTGNPTKCIDGGSAEVRIGFGEEPQGPGYPHVLAWTALIFLACVASQGMENAGSDAMVGIVEGGDKYRKCLVVDEAIEQVDARPAYYRVDVPESSPEGGDSQ